MLNYKEERVYVLKIWKEKHHCKTMILQGTLPEFTAEEARWLSMAWEKNNKLRPAQHYLIKFLPAGFFSSDKIENFAKALKKNKLAAAGVQLPDSEGESFSGSRDDDVDSLPSEI